MLERLIRGASALLVCLVALGASDDARPGAGTAPPAAPPADIELRKSFRFVRRAARQPSWPVDQGRTGDDPSPPGAGPGGHSPRLETVASALGELLQTTGTLHLPEVGEGGTVLQGSDTPILETVSGRRLIIDRERTISPEVVDGISSRWPGFSVVQPRAGAGLREIIGSLLDAAGYDSVLRETPLVFGRGITIRFTPDFVVLRSEHDLLAGETRAISVVEPAAVLPPELRELAAEHRVRIVELTAEGDAAGEERAPWRDSAGRVTTVEAARLAPIVEEIAVALGCAVERRAAAPGTSGARAGGAELRISRGGKVVAVFEKPDPLVRESAGTGGGETITVASAAALSEAVGTLLARLDIPAIGPAVEFYRAAAPGTPRRFVINVPGWLADSGGRRLLITGVSPPPLVRLYLTREGIDLIEYRIR